MEQSITHARRLSPSHDRILATLRTSFNGATATQVAENANLSVSHTRRGLRLLRTQGIVQCKIAYIPWDHGHHKRRARVWALQLSMQTLDALRLLTSHPAPVQSCDGVPTEYRWMFGTPEIAAELRLTEDALQIAGRMIGGLAPLWQPQAWALTHLPVATLETLRAMRGYDHEPEASFLDAAICVRSHDRDGLLRNTFMIP